LGGKKYYILPYTKVGGHVPPVAPLNSVPDAKNNAIIALLQEIVKENLVLFENRNLYKCGILSRMNVFYADVYSSVRRI